MLINCSPFITCGMGWYVVQCSLCVAPVCCMLLAAHNVCVRCVCSKMLYVTHCSLGVAYVYVMLFTAHYLSLTFVMWCSLLITCGFLVFAIYCSLLTGCSYLCVAYTSIYVVHIQCMSHKLNTYAVYWFSHYYCAKIYIYI